MLNNITRSTISLGIKIVCVIAGTEVAIMAVFQMPLCANRLTPWMMLAIDVSVLSLVTSIIAFYCAMWPVTKLLNANRQMEEALRETIMSYRSLVDDAQEIMYSIALDGTFIFLNSAFERITGWPRNECIGKPFISLLHLHDVPVAQKVFQDILVGKTPGYCQLRFLSQSGEYLTGEFFGQPHLQNEKIDSVWGMVRDITAFKQREKDLAHKLEFEEVLSRISCQFAQLPDIEKAIHASLADIGKLTKASRVYLFLVSKEKMMNITHEWCSRGVSAEKDNLQNIPMDRFAWLMEKLREDSFISIRDVSTLPLEAKAEKEEFERKGIKSLLLFPLNIRGELNGFVGMDNITSSSKHWSDEDILILRTLSDLICNALGHKRAIDAIIQAKQDWEDTFDLISDIITIHDRDFNIIRANKAAREMLSMPSLEIPNKCYQCYQCYHGQTSPPQDCKSCQALRTKATVTYEIFEPHLNKSLEFTAIPRLNKEGENLGTIHIVRDITEHKKLKERVNQTQKMQAMGHLSGGIAHDFNNILSAIIGYSDLLQRKMKSDDPLRRNVEQILKAAESATQLTRNLLTFSRKQIVEFKPINLNEVVQRMEKILARVIREDIELRLMLADVTLTIMGDSSQIDQILINLATNARDAMPKGGRLIFKTDVAPLKEELAQIHPDAIHRQYALLSVSDTGIGMDENTKQRLFEPFFTTKEVGKGTGFGLSIVYGVVKQHKGYIQVESEPGKGTSFYIYLPLTELDVKQTKREETMEFKTGNEIILLAEDHAPVRNLFTAVLTEFGYNVIETTDGEECIGKFIQNQGSVQLVILDVIMPKKNGKEVCEEIRKIKPGVKVLFISGYTADIIRQNGIVEEKVAFMYKPVLPRQLLAKVREILDRK